MIVDTIKAPAVVLLSGGQDSATCLAWASLRFSSVHCIAFDYGQKHRVELECAEELARTFKAASFRIINLTGVFPPSALTNHSLDPGGKHAVADLPATFTAGRNIVFLSIAAGHAYQAGIQHIATGVCQTDYSGYPDCRAGFISAMQQAVSSGLDSHISIHTPLMYLTKAETWKLAADMGVLDVIVGKTHTCYNGVRDTLHSWGYGCGECPACKLRKNGWNDFYSQDAGAAQHSIGCCP